MEAQAENVQTYRFKFTPEIMNSIQEFTRIHKYDEREEFKDAWDTWCDDNIDDIQTELDRLEEMGWEGDIKDKMYKSARYYFKNKSIEIKDPKKRQKYVRVTSEIRILIDRHITSNIGSDQYSPANGLTEFYEMNTDTIENEHELLGILGFSKQQIDDKIKKTYKNRYFQYVKKLM